MQQVAYQPRGALSSRGGIGWHEARVPTIVTSVPNSAFVDISSAGPAGLATAVTAAQRGHEVTLFEAGAVVGGQFDLARRIPGKEEFRETVRYYTRMLDKHRVDVRLNTRADVDALTGFDDVVLATGVAPRIPDIPGIDHPMVLSYAEAILGKPVGGRVAVVGAGGIGFDVSEFLVAAPAEPANERRSPSTILKEWKAEWGAADPQQARGALTTPIPMPPAREVYLLQRTKGPQGRRLGKTSGKVQQLSGVNYEHIDDGLHISFGTSRSGRRLLAVDNVVICAGQEPVRDLEDGLRRNGIEPHIIGGAALAGQLDAKRAIKQGTELAARL